jgi:hypothetical protein
MRQSVITVVVGLASGVVAALVSVHLAVGPTPRPAPRAATVPVPRQSPIVPPGWDPSILARVANLESRLAGTKPEAATTESRADSGTSENARQREQGRLAQYQRELAYLQQVLTDHDQEPHDPAWSRPLEEALDNRLAASVEESSGQVKGIDCRSRTCTAALTFRTPVDALVYMRQPLANRVTEGCKGLVAIPAPP